jgi:DNA-binding beta-propeller fold protein YncE
VRREIIVPSPLHWVITSVMGNVMRKRILIAAALLTFACGSLAAFTLDKERASPGSPARLLPGVQPGGEVLLPNQWSLRPAGKNISLGDFPVNIALHPSGQWLAVLHAGYSEHEVVVVELSAKKQRIVSRITLEQTFVGLCFAPDGKTLYASGGEFEVVHAYTFDDGLLSHHRKLEVAPEKDTFIVGGLALDGDGKLLCAAGAWGDAVCLLPLDKPADRRRVDLEKGSYPYTCLPEPKGKRVFVSLWGKSAVAVIDREDAKVIGTWKTKSHPTEMALSPDGKALFVACANSTQVSVLDAAHNGDTLETINCALYPGAPSGNTPNSLCLTPDGEMLFVANADANNVAVFKVTEPGKSQPLGFIPVGWYPTSVRYNPQDKRLYVANGKGLTSRANPQGPGPDVNRNLGPIYQYIGALMQGTLSVIDLPTPAQIAAFSKQAYACSPLHEDQSATGHWSEGNPIPKKLGDGSPIKHCIYIIKENRTYDQVFGDVKEGNGEPDLCLFGAKVTPNHHKLAKEFVLLDNFYVDGEVSADGHQWSMGAYATDFVEKIWPLTYRRSPLKKLDIYPSEGNLDAVARPSGGYIWDRCAEAGVTYRSYGEWIHNGKNPGDPAVAAVKSLEGHFDPQFVGWDMDYPDEKRADRFIEELAGFEKAGKMPSLIILRLPNDHTSGTQVGKLTPTANVADNDLALGKVAEAVSKSKFWKDTAIFVLEDDAQNGPDHVDAHRSVALVVSPYTKRNHVDSTMYSTSSMLRTMELILGLKPMSQFDAAAAPMYGSFQAKPDLTTYQHAVPDVDLKEKNKATAWGANISELFDLTKEDAVDDLLLNEVIWRSVKGPHSPMPAPVRAAFVVPNKRKDADD